MSSVAHSYTPLLMVRHYCALRRPGRLLEKDLVLVNRLYFASEEGLRVAENLEERRGTDMRAGQMPFLGGTVNAAALDADDWTGMLGTGLDPTNQNKLFYVQLKWRTWSGGSVI